jgi:hypothetical protein
MKQLNRAGPLATTCTIYTFYTYDRCSRNVWCARTWHLYYVSCRACGGGSSAWADRRAWDQRDETQCKLVVRTDFFKIIFFMINYKFRSCYKKIDIYISLSAAQRPIGALSAAHWPIGMCSLLGRRACYCSGACGAPRDKFRGPEMHFQNSRAYVTPLTSSVACDAFNSFFIGPERANVEVQRRAGLSERDGPNRRKPRWARSTLSAVVRASRKKTKGGRRMVSFH